jgi:hypothetical protein
MLKTSDKYCSQAGGSPADLVRSAIRFDRPERILVYDTFWNSFVHNWRQYKQLGNELHPADYYNISMSLINN